jgi:hypothetical protein
MFLGKYGNGEFGLKSVSFALVMGMNLARIAGRVSYTRNNMICIILESCWTELLP